MICHLFIDKLADNLSLTGVDEGASLHNLCRRAVIIPPPAAETATAAESAATPKPTSG